MNKVAKISIVVPVYNEKDVLPQSHAAIRTAAEATGSHYEIIYVDDGSHDGSAQWLDTVCATCAEVRVLHLSRNYGQEAAMLAGIDHATGDAVVCMDADMQHPPSMLSAMTASISDGYDVVLMRRRQRKDGSASRKSSTKLFYRILNLLSDIHIEPGVADFFMISDAVARRLRNDYRERTRFLRVLVQGIGFRQTIIDYDAPPRAAGESKYSTRRLVRLSLTAMAVSSKRPLMLGIYAGIVFAMLSMVLMVYSAVMWVLDKPVGGYTTLIIFLSVFASVLLLVLGIIGYYVGLIFDEVKARPIYIVSKELPAPTQKER